MALMKISLILPLKIILISQLNRGECVTACQGSSIYIPLPNNIDGSRYQETGKEILGTWKMYLDAFDRNENQLLEEEERKKGVPNHYILQFNADGTCRIQNMFNGTYKIKDGGGKKVLVVQRKRVVGEETEDPMPDIYHIKSVTREELILLVVDGGMTTTFWIFKKMK